jgi:nucleoside-diphosphate-sugar epimerase
MDMDRMRVLVTGHNGYVGSVLVRVLRAAGHDVRGMDTFFFEDCTIGPDERHAPVVRKDIRDVEVADLQGLDAIIHLAALSSDPLGEQSPERTNDINHHGAVRLARCARDAGVSRFLFASSSSVYGDSGAEEQIAEDAPLRPVSPYAVSKARAEEDLVRLGDGDFSPCFLRSGVVYGVSPRLRADTVLNNLVCWAHTTGRVRILSQGRRWCPMVHVQDLAWAFAAALTAPRGAVHGEAFNVGAKGENYEIAELAEIVCAAVPACSIEHAEGADADSRDYRLDFGKLARTFPHFRPQWNATFGAKELYAALQEADVTQEDLKGRKYIRLTQLKYLLASELVDDQLRWVPAAVSGAGA